MKKFGFLIASVLCNLLCSAQNSYSVTISSPSLTAATATLTNKTNGSLILGYAVTYTLSTPSAGTPLTLLPNQSTQIQVTLKNGLAYLWVGKYQNLGNDMFNPHNEGSVTTIAFSSLPVKWVQMPRATYDRLNHTLTVTYSVAEVTDTKLFHIKASFDGHEWKEIAIVFPDDVQPNRLYTIKIKI